MTRLLIAAVLSLMSVEGWGQAPEHMQKHHADPAKDDWIRSLKKPGTDLSCCNLNDCDPTDAEWRGGDDGQWWALSHVKGQGYVPIPPEKIVTKQKSFDGEAWLCQGLREA